MILIFDICCIKIVRIEKYFAYFIKEKYLHL